MSPLTEEEIVRMLATHPFDDKGSPTISRDDAVAITRWHLEIEEVEAYNTDDEIWQMWQSGSAASSAEDINAGVLEHVLDQIKEET